MRCPLHVGAEMIPEKQDTPNFGTVAHDENVYSRRTVLKCPIPFCRCVQVQYEVSRIIPVICYRCKRNKASIAGNLCRPCAKKYREQKRVVNSARGNGSTNRAQAV